jgi:glucoamylase
MLQRTRFSPCKGCLDNFHLYALLAPHLGNQGTDNSAWVCEYKGVPMLFASHGSLALALACSLPSIKSSAGYVGVSDGWQDINRHKEMTWAYERAPNGNVALTGEIDLQACQGEFILALGFGINPDEAAQRTLASLQDGFEAAQKTCLHQWQHWLVFADPDPPAGSEGELNLA